MVKGNVEAAVGNIHQSPSTKAAQPAAAMFVKHYTIHTCLPTVVATINDSFFSVLSQALLTIFKCSRCESSSLNGSIE